VLSGNNDGTISIFRNDTTTGYATAVAYFSTGSAFSINDMDYNESTGRVVLITDNEIFVLGFDAATGDITVIDKRQTSGNSSHLAVNSSGTAAYVASGTSTGQNIDAFTISSSGTLSIANSTLVKVDPDYIKLNPAESRLYLVSRTDAQILIFDINADASLAGSPQTVVTDPSPTALLFNTDGTVAYLSRANNFDHLVVYSVDAAGMLFRTTALSSRNHLIDMVLSANGQHLYALDSQNNTILHHTIDSAGVPTFFGFTNVSFTPTDLTLSHTGAVLYVGHSEENLVSSINVDQNDGSLSVVNWVRAYNSVNSVAAIGGLGDLQPVATHLLAPDETGLSLFAIAADGTLSFETMETSSGALIDGEVAVDYTKALLLGAGEDAAATDILTSYQYDLASGSASVVSTIDATVSSQSSFKRLELGRSGRFMYVLDKDVLDSFNNERGFIRTYAYAANGTITTASIDTDIVGQAPENLSLHPAGRFIYSVNSFDDTISRFEINESTGSLTGGTTYSPGGRGAGVGRPLDMRFHPNGRYAYVSLEDDNQMVRYEVATNGALQNISRLTLPTFNGANVEPGPIAVHPNGKHVYVGERNGLIDSISVLSVNPTDYSLTHHSRITASDNPSWLSVDPQGRFLYVRFGNESIQVFSIDQSSGNLTDTQQVVSAGNRAGFLPTMTLVTPLQ
jgi:6-phosphogluconolactonase (cycloisomerase 2 family)